MERRRGSDLIIDDFRQVAMRKLIVPEDQNDPYIPNLAQSLWDLTHEPEIENELLEIANLPNRMDKSAAYLTNIIFMRINEKHLTLDINENAKLNDESYPQKLVSEDVCRKLIWEALIYDKKQSRNIHHDNILHREIQTNWYPRYSILKLLPFIYPELGDHPSYLDKGASQNYGLKWLKRNREVDKLPINPVTVYDADYAHPPDRDLPVDQERTIILNNLLSRDFIPAECMGLDWWPADEPANKLWVAANARPNEIGDKKRFEILADLNQEVADVNFLSNIDCSNTSQLAQELGNKKYDVVSLFMMLHQNNPSKIREIVQNAQGLAKEIVVIFDVISVDEDNHAIMHTPDDLYSEDDPYSFRVLVMKMKKRHEGFQEIARFKNGRCRDVILNTENEDVYRAFS